VAANSRTIDGKLQFPYGYSDKGPGIAGGCGNIGTPDWCEYIQRIYLFLRCHFILKLIILPRQARDKHCRESTQARDDAFFAGSTLRTRQWPSVQKTALFAPFIYKNEHFAKTGSGQT
jgi:hypothetical protein